jgi:hypothetical protein
MEFLKEFNNNGYEVGLVFNIKPKDKDIYLLFLIEESQVNVAMVKFFDDYYTDDDFGDDCIEHNVFVNMITNKDYNSYGKKVNKEDFLFYIKLNKDEVNLDA